MCAGVRTAGIHRLFRRHVIASAYHLAGTGQRVSGGLSVNPAMRAKPKSKTLTMPFLSTRRLLGLMSR